MENASKALIIAGAILLSILLISLGIVVVNNTRSTIDKANVNQTEVQTFNSPFESYVRNNVTASEIRTMISTIISSNGAQASNATYHFIAVSNTGTLPTAPAATLTTAPNVAMPNNLIAGKTYTVQVGYDGSGYVNRITYKAN